MDIDKIYIYRITHIENVEYVLKNNKLTTFNSKDADNNYVGIGERELINLRSDHEIITSNSNQKFCPSRDFLPFYFAPKSVMLYRIQTGWNVDRLDPEKIVYFVFKLDKILPFVKYLFTDGHGYAKLSQWFDDIKFLSEIKYVDIIREVWKDVLEDGDRQRRKQAEFWIENEISLNLLEGIGVYDEKSKAYVQKIVDALKSPIQVKIKKEYYY